MQVADSVHDPGGKSRPPWPSDSKVTAVFSDCQCYRYQLREVWDAGKPIVLWILMNPSVACLDYSDPTLKRTGTFSRDWGYGGQLVGNVHAYRATDKKELLKVDDPVGPANDEAILEMANQAETVVLAYGLPPKRLRRRSKEVESLLADHPSVSYLRLTKDGMPEHPLYLPKNLIPLPYRKQAKL
ncbi:DUF1643 domain-containing protein [Pelagicoccus sp. SDUM812005]|uniref:DUF1643 domain-containing protein n=1 Tax=Pelagicoccus sp. SDUM812005 TaxID=3041257 RepID=UPI00280E439B|nr:DUF1643 domain-containing protein [Pelagicoccus sp. SDUM812005]MDQ8180358.1 DUF1643 domain-containing protein [Pelagicoccus sp. SDUM812005]